MKSRSYFPQTELLSRVVLVVAIGSTVLLLGLVMSKCDSTKTSKLPVEQITVADDGLTISAVVYTNTCGHPERLVFDQTSTEVRVGALVRIESGPCDDVGVAYRLTGTLLAPLSNRTVRSG